MRRFFQDPKGRLHLNPVDLDARWRSVRGVTGLSYRQHVLVEDHGFVLGELMTRSTTREAEPLLGMIQASPVKVRVLTADTGYSLGLLRRELARQGVEAHIPLHTRHLERRAKRAGFWLRHPQELICPQGRVLRRSSFDKKDDTWVFAARVKDCQVCPRGSSCLPPQSRRRFIQLSEYEAEFNEACQTNSTFRHRRLTARRKTVVEGVFAHLDAMGFRRLRRRGLERVQVEGLLVPFAHNILKAASFISRQRGGALAARSSHQDGLVALHAPA